MKAMLRLRWPFRRRKHARKHSSKSNAPITSEKDQKPSLPPLPAELWEIILEILSDVSRPDLLNCSLLNRQFHSLAARFVWRQFTLRAHHDGHAFDFFKQSRAILDYPERGRYVRTLRVQFSDMQPGTKELALQILRDMPPTTERLLFLMNHVTTVQLMWLGLNDPFLGVVSPYITSGTGSWHIIGPADSPVEGESFSWEILRIYSQWIQNSRISALEILRFPFWAVRQLVQGNTFLEHLKIREAPSEHLITESVLAAPTLSGLRFLDTSLALAPHFIFPHQTLRSLQLQPHSTSPLQYHLGDRIRETDTPLSIIHTRQTSTASVARLAHNIHHPRTCHTIKVISESERGLEDCGPYYEKGWFTHLHAVFENSPPTHTYVMRVAEFSDELWSDLNSGGVRSFTMMLNDYLRTFADRFLRPRVILELGHPGPRFYCWIFTMQMDNCGVTWAARCDIYDGRVQDREVSLYLVPEEGTTLLE
ncbi:hypothetical protein DL93DRAFT_2165042 [Clavulina sp. PMI_390]|nr:hypothetical protein DL93DRAFT_2165042 [Clavulina sp. PMI_390]